MIWIGTVGPTDATSWLRTRRALHAPRVRVVCFPYAGGGASIYHRWSDKLPASIEVRAVQLPGRQDRLREAPLKRMSEIVDNVEAALSLLPPCPAIFFGYSFGALVAFELARRLQRAGTPPLALVVGAARAPGAERRESSLHLLDEEAFLHAIHQRYETPWSVLRDPDLMSLALPSLRADMEALETHEHDRGFVLDISVTALRGLRDGCVSATDVAAWRDVTRSKMTLDEVDGGHFFIHTCEDWTIGHVRNVVTEA